MATQEKSSILHKWREQGTTTATEEEITTLLGMSIYEDDFYDLLSISEAALWESLITAWMENGKKISLR